MAEAEAKVAETTLPKARPRTLKDNLISLVRSRRSRVMICLAIAKALVTVVVVEDVISVIETKAKVVMLRSQNKNQQSPISINTTR